MTSVIKHYWGIKKKKRGERSIDGFRKKLMIPESEISESSEHKVKSKKGKIFVNKKILEECCVKICEIDPYFYEHYEELIKIDKNGRDNILFKIDIYFLNIT